MASGWPGTRPTAKSSMRPLVFTGPMLRSVAPARGDEAGDCARTTRPSTEAVARDETRMRIGLLSAASFVICMSSPEQGERCQLPTVILQCEA